LAGGENRSSRCFSRSRIEPVTDIKTATSPLPAILVCTLGIFLLSAMDAAVKGLVVVIGAYNTLLWRSVFATATAGTAWAATTNRRTSLGALRLHVLRGVVVTFVALTFFFGLGRLPLAEAIALSFIAPLVALFLAAILLGERIGRSAIWASLVGMIGVLVIMLGKFSGSGYAPDALLGTAAVIVSAVLYAYNLILARQQAQVAKPLEIVFIQNLVVGVTLGLASPWLGVALPQALWLPLAGVTALALVGHATMSWAYARAEAQYLIPTEYSAFVWAIVLGWVFFHEAVSWTTLAGAALIIGGCLIASRAKPKLAEPIEAAAV
jgi:S-adenosylmethionine uptake transporter